MHVRRSTSDRYVSKEVFRWGDYAAPRGIVFDIGANIGAFSLYAAQTADKVYAFEPESSNHAQLLKNIAANRFTNIVPIKKAVGGTTGSVLLHRAVANKGGASIATAISDDVEPVDMVTLEEAMKMHGVEHINVLKVDIEGSEYALFEHVSLDTLRRVDRVEMETHPVEGKRIEDMVTKLSNAGFTVEQRRTRLSFLGLGMLIATRE